MAEIARFYGIVIEMFHLPREHGPAHIHAYYAEQHCRFSIASGIRLDDDYDKKFKSTAEKLVKQFIEQHRAELMQMWETQDFGKLEFIED